MTTTTEQTPNQRLGSTVDLDTEKAGLRAIFSELLIAGREIRPIFSLYKDPNRVMTINSRLYDNPEDERKALMELLYMFPAVHAHTGILGYPYHAQLSSGVVCPSLFLIAISPNGAFTEVLPYKLEDTNLEFLDEEVSAIDNIPEWMQRMLPVFATIKRSTFQARHLVAYLLFKGHEIELAHNWTFENLETKSDLP